MMSGSIPLVKDGGVENYGSPDDTGKTEMTLGIKWDPPTPSCPTRTYQHCCRHKLEWGGLTCVVATVAVGLFTLLAWAHFENNS